MPNPNEGPSTNRYGFLSSSNAPVEKAGITYSFVHEKVVLPVGVLLERISTAYKIDTENSDKKLALDVLSGCHSNLNNIVDEPDSQHTASLNSMK